jgi:hypothetical protein
VDHIIVMRSKVTSHLTMTTHRVMATLIILALCGYGRVVHDGLDSLWVIHVLPG